MSSESIGYADRQDESSTLDPGTVIRERFLLEEELDYGRFGSLYKALDRQRSTAGGHTSHVALQVLPAEAVRDPRMLETFKRNFARLQSLKHPNVVSVFDFDRDDDVHFVTMEHVEGESMRTIVDSLRPDLLVREEAVAVVRAIGEALVHAHERGVIHGDVRLENVIVTAAEHDVKVLFSSACVMSRAPFSVEPRDDLHSLAYVTYELLAGTPPFAGRQSLVARRRAVEPKRIPMLSRSQWKALRGLLVYDGHPRTTRQFLDELCGATTKPARRGEAARERRGGWRWVAAAWLVIALAAGYLLGRDRAKEPAAEEIADVVPEEAPALSTPALSNLDGRRASGGSAPIETYAVSRAVPLADTQLPAVDAEVSVVSFAAGAVSASESAGVVTLELRRSGGAQEASVVWWTSAGTARPGDDYADFGQVVETFRNGERSRKILVPITSDGLIEGREYFRVYLREMPGGKARLGAITEVTVTLLDDDG